MGILDRLGLSKLKQGLSRTRDGLATQLGRLLSGAVRVDEQVLERMEEILLSADAGVQVTTEIVDALRRKVKEEGLSDPAGLQPLLKEEVVRVLQAGTDGSTGSGFTVWNQRPLVVMVVGVNGVGKTTTIGKLARRFILEGRKVVIAAADTFRAAANEQLEVWAQRAGAEIIQQTPGSDPAAVAFDSVRAAVARKSDVVIVDTAGRLHTKLNLMEELKKIRRALQKVIPEAPHEVLLVLDATTGQNGLQQARQFGSAVGVTGIVLTKLDGTAKGGIVLAIAREVNIPVRFVGVGEGIDDLQPFDRHAFADALFTGDP